ncbi:hypothetical protein OGM63_00570 [Plectonema radiosum NIES-515]|uniref:Plastid lipid-associated protein/fibrillin conserved domain-containing protein n=1 Tax=Plectonema radiosum NIES-515 TaxID=2986073 RepID=A0ABT3ASD2_9CYAN|nr:hypothetical protein [Plectonema radiosum]MCV3212030.1 hypothetical protein [Plectonema radiosum NIES-515]
MEKIITQEFITLLTQSQEAYRGQKIERPPALSVVNALLQAEKAAKQQRLTYPFESMLGKWRLCFTTGTKKVKHRRGIKLGNGFYLPKFAPAHICFSATQNADKGEITNSIQFGSLQLKLTGPAKYLGKKNLLAFEFTQMQISLFRRTIYNGEIRGGKTSSEDFDNRPLSLLPFFAFFLVTPDLIAARGRGGGLALWIRD